MPLPATTQRGQIGEVVALQGVVRTNYPNHGEHREESDPIVLAPN